MSDSTASYPDKAQDNQSDIVFDTNWNEAVKQDDLIKAWLKYAKSIEAKNSRLASILHNHLPELQSGVVVRVKLKNKSQDNELQEQKSNIFLFLRKELKNANLELETQLVTEGQKSTKAFTATEKAKLMAKKNPALLLLTKKFDLDIE